MKFKTILEVSTENSIACPDCAELIEVELKPAQDILFGHDCAKGKFWVAHFPPSTSGKKAEIFVNEKVRPRSR